MSFETMGSTIAALRKEKAVTQEALAAYIGVSAQAVSKWEKGGAPDCALLPLIADFFGVSIDFLFGRTPTDYSSFDSALTKKIISTPWEEKLNLLYSLCWTMQIALFGHSSEEYSYESLRTPDDSGNIENSEFHGGRGYTMVNFGNRLPYFLLLPETPAFSSFQTNSDEFCAFFKALSDKVVFDTLVLLMRLPEGKFTAQGLGKKLKIDETKMNDVLSILTGYHLLRSDKIELDDTTYTVYSVNIENCSAFTPLLIFAQRFIMGSNGFCFFQGGYPCLK